MVDYGSPPDFTIRLSSFELRLKEQSLAGEGGDMSYAGRS